jgi:hypothetical protein
MDGALWWESHAGFTRTKNGRCFIESNVLFLEPAVVVREPGFLIKEYNEALEELPQWKKTPYYCTNYTLKPCQVTKVFSGKQYGRSFREGFKYVRDRISTDRKTFKKIAEIKTGVTTYKDRFFKRI